ncbi:MAG: CDP-alcohol phosphatidyltransferase family protein [Candidatus Pacebacteria bacterium]|nr:CDP-alcohol phosphatidyltransferase family protein [Candidatus Paceibacterota bacterium]
MKALIIAAGNGTRMQLVTRGRHKSLMSLLGLKIIERVILGAKEAGIFEFVIITGYKGKELKETIGDGSRFGVSIAYVHNNKWEEANGISVLKAKDYFKEDFILLMSDHVFDWRTLLRLKRIKLKKDECTLAIDKNMDSVLDIDDTTKVLVKNNKIDSISKNLNVYNAYDTGMFLCSPYIFEILKKTISDHKNSLTNGMRVIAKEGKLRAFNIKGRFWSDCDTYADIKFAEKKLLKNLNKSEDGIISKIINRKVSIFISKYLVKTGLTPNKISILNLMIGISSAFLFAKGSFPWIFIGGVLAQLTSITDGCDGEIARLKFLSSKFGAWLDDSFDRYIDMLIVIGMAYGYWAISQNSLVWPIAAFAVMGLALLNYLPAKHRDITDRKLVWYGPKFKRPGRLLLIMFAGITGLIFPALILIALISNLISVSRIIVSARENKNSAKNKAQKKYSQSVRHPEKSRISP